MATPTPAEPIAAPLVAGYAALVCLVAGWRFRRRDLLLS